MRALLATTLAAAALALGACGDTVQSAPVGRGAIASLLLEPFPVYWVGTRFRGLQAREVVHDPSGAVTLEYGDCLEGGQVSCVEPLRIVTSPNNSFVPGIGPSRATSVRGVAARSLDGGSTIIIPTGRVVLDVYANSSALAREAAAAVVPVGDLAQVGAALPALAAPTAAGALPLKGQLPELRPAGPRRRVRRRGAAAARRSSSA